MTTYHGYEEHLRPATPLPRAMRPNNHGVSQRTIDRDRAEREFILTTPAYLRRCIVWGLREYQDTDIRTCTWEQLIEEARFMCYYTTTDTTHDALTIARQLWYAYGRAQGEQR